MNPQENRFATFENGLTVNFKRKVFFSFKYEDVQRAMHVRSSNGVSGAAISGFIDKADFEELEYQGDDAIKAWIDEQLDGTSVTVVLVGANTASSRWVKYEIDQSIARGNGIFTIDISKIADLQGNTTSCCYLRVSDYAHYLWNKDNGQDNLGKWVEAAAAATSKLWTV